MSDPLPSWEGSGAGRFMESPDAFLTVHWDHEPDLHKPLNDEGPMTNDERNPKPECPIALSCAVAGFVIRISSFLRISSFVIRVSQLRFMAGSISGDFHGVSL